MAGTQHLWLFIVSGLLLNITPGPDSLFIMARSATQGWRAGFVACWGVGSGVFVHVSAAALGLSALLATSATAFAVVKVIGAAYLVWIGIGMLRAMMNSESGPGVMLSSSPETMNSHRCWVPAMRPSVSSENRMMAASAIAVNAAACRCLLRQAD